MWGGSPSFQWRQRGEPLLLDLVEHILVEDKTPFVECLEIHKALLGERQVVVSFGELIDKTFCSSDLGFLEQFHNTVILLSDQVLDDAVCIAWNISFVEHHAVRERILQVLHELPCKILSLHELVCEKIWTAVILMVGP